METMTMIGYALFFTFAASASVALVLYLVFATLRLFLDNKRIRLEEKKLAEGRRSQDRLSEVLGQVVPVAVQAMSAPTLPSLPSCEGCAPGPNLHSAELLNIEGSRLAIERDRLQVDEARLKLEQERNRIVSKESEGRLDLFKQMYSKVIEALVALRNADSDPPTGNAPVTTPAEA